MESKKELELIKTADGSNTIFNPWVGENYHSTNGALQESRHVFVNAGLRHFLSRDAHQTVSILEVGFGTGLNFLLSADVCMEQGVALEYTGIEAYPLDLEMISQTGYDQYTSTDIWERFISNYERSLKAPVRLNDLCQLQTAHCELRNFDTEKQYDIIYFDAFASAHQPEMWNEEAIAHTIKFLKPGGIFVTYAITGNLKRMLKALNCKIEKLPGALGKREMLRAVKL